MSSGESNERLLREGVEAYNRGDIEALVPLMHPEIESHVAPGQGNPGTWYGVDGFRQMTGAWNEAFAEVETIVVSVEMPDDRHLIAEMRQTAVGSASRVPVEMTNYYLVEIRGGQMMRFHIYNDRQAAIGAIRPG